MKFNISKIAIIICFSMYCAFASAQRRNPDVIQSLQQLQQTTSQPVQSIQQKALKVASALRVQAPAASKRTMLSQNMSMETCCATSVRLSDSLMKDNKETIRFELNKGDKLVNNSKRSELVIDKEKTMNVERWYKFSIFLPKDFKPDSIDEILAQWHETPDKKLGESWRIPPISLRIVKNLWMVKVLYASAPVNTNETIDGTKSQDLGDFVPNNWANFVFHIKFSYKNDGILQVWKNGKLVFDYNGPNYYNDKIGPFFKVGIYKARWKDKINKSVVSKRVVYFSDIVVQDTKPTIN